MKLREKKLQRVVYVESFLIEIFQREREREVVFKKETDNEAKVYRREKNTIKKWEMVSIKFLKIDRL